MHTFDEPEIVARSAALDRTQKSAFAAACAERLMPLFSRYAASIQSVDENALRLIVDQVWRAVAGVAVEDLGKYQSFAEDLVPDEDEQWLADTAYAQNAAASAAYAVRT